MNKGIWMKQSRQENLIYIAVWGLLFAAPVLSLYVRTVSNDSVVFDWTEVFVVWRKFAVYLLLFLVHNFLLAPLLVHGRRRVAYVVTMILLLAAFAVYQYNSKPAGWDERRHKPSVEQLGHRHEPPMGQRGQHERPDDMRPMELDGKRPPEFDGKRPPELRERPHGDRRRLGPPPIIGERDILAVVVVLLMFGANLGIKAIFRSRDDRRRLAELERQNLEQQLVYLRYQINPHFFMNTLNNIHALVDIDPAKAQETIRELSKMMRFVLYEGNKQSVPLAKEMEFIRTYVKLMQLRYTDKVRIVLDLPATTPDLNVPPLLLITFIENAFKHGISYQQDSFIEAKVEVADGKLRFTCVNSKAAKPNEEKGGVGLDNVRKRLKLLYGSNYSLSLLDHPDTYHVNLEIPL